MKQATVSRKTDGLTINFQGDVAKKDVISMVERCQTGGCDCMSEENKAKIKNMHVEGSDGDVKVHLDGEDINMDEIKISAQKCDC